MVVYRKNQLEETEKGEVGRIMSLDLNHHMHTLSHHGLQIIRKNEQAIRKEWKQMKQYFENNNKKSAKSTIASVQIFSNTIFNQKHDLDLVMQHLKIAWEHEITIDNHISPFIMSLLEGAVHHATQHSSSYKDEDYQAIQYFFLKMNEHIHAYTSSHPFSIHTFMEHLVHSRQLAIEWIAIVEKTDGKFYLKNWCHKNSCALIQDDIFANSLFELTDLLLMALPQEHEHSIMTVPYSDITLLVCTMKKDTGHVMPFVHHAVQLLESGKQTMEQAMSSQRWMDAVLLFNESMIRTHTLEEALETITTGFVHYLPFKRCAIFSYSKQDEIALGLSGYQLDNQLIRNITAQMNHMPQLKQSLDIIQMLGMGMKYLQPLYMADAANYLPAAYIEQFQLQSVVITPLYTASGNELIGAAVLDEGAHSDFSLSYDTYNALIHFGKNAGEMLQRYRTMIHSFTQTNPFSPREMEVLELMAEGESTTSAAHSLHLSEYTVRDYITNIMQKMNAKNRTEAVALAIRKGII